MLDSRINQNFNRPIVSPQFRASQNVSKPAKAEEKQGMSTTAKWAIGIGLTALASYGIYYALTKGRVKSPKPTPKPENPAPEIKEMAIDAFKREGRFENGKAILKDKNGAYTIDYTGNITSTGKDGSKVVMEYVDGILQKSTKTAKDGTNVFDKTYSYIYDGRVPYLSGVKKNGEVILDEKKLVALYEKVNKELIEKNHDALSIKYPNIIKNLEEINANIENTGDQSFINMVRNGNPEYFPLGIYGYTFDNNGKIIKKTLSNIKLEEGLIELKKQNKDLLNDFKLPLNKRFPAILDFYQQLDNHLIDLPKNENNKKISISINKTLEDLGYKFKDFDPKNYEEFYEVPSDKANMVELIRRAIVDKEGKTIAKGKVYLPENF